jgi:hypothetical protein
MSIAEKFCETVGFCAGHVEGCANSIDARLFFVLCWVCAGWILFFGFWFSEAVDGRFAVDAGVVLVEELSLLEKLCSGTYFASI